MRRPVLAFCLVLLASPPAAALAQNTPPAPAQQAPLAKGQIDALMAPVALYPDALLSKILIASTFPDQVLDAAHWRKNNSGLKDGALDRAVAAKMWDDNVKALAHIPGVLDMMSGQQDWMYRLGGAFVGQQSDVMASIQRLRRQARAHGMLATSPQQRVVEQGETIVIESAQPRVVYVPYYNPLVVYGAWAYPAYQPYYWAVPYGYGYPAGAFARGLAWGAGVAISAAIWSNAFDWRNHNVWYGGGWHGGGAWNRGYYNNWNNNGWRGGHNVNIHNNNVNIGGHNNFNRGNTFSNRGGRGALGNRGAVRRGGSHGTASGINRGGRGFAGRGGRGQGFGGGRRQGGFGGRARGGRVRR